MTSRNRIGAGRAAVSAGQQMLATAVQHFQAGRLGEAQAVYSRILAGDPGHILALNHLAIVEFQLGRTDESLRLLGQCLALKPDYAQGYSDLAVIHMQLGRDKEAIEACQKAIALDPRVATAHSNLGDLLRRGGDNGAAEQAYGRAVQVQPKFPAAHANRADVLIALGRLDEARRACEKALRQAPGLALAHGVKGLILYCEGRHEQAVAAYEKALRLDRGLALVHTRLANALKELGRLDEALAANARALAADPSCIEALCNQALTLQALGRYDEAFKAYSDALTLDPDSADTLASLGLLQHGTGNSEQAVATLRRALTLDPHAGSVYVNLGNILKDKGEYAEAAGIYRAMLDACPDAPPPQGLYDYCNLRRHICDWNGLDEAERHAIETLKLSGDRMPPFAALAMSCSPQDHLDLARRWADGFQYSGRPAARPAASRGRIRIGYLSADFYQHATATLIAELIERHDRDRFEVSAWCFSPDDGSPMRNRLKAAFDRFTSVEPLTHSQAADIIAADGIDILVDLKGYTRNARSMILAQRPAPIQVNYLGYPGTMGAPFMDYIIGDPIVTPMEHQPFFDERIVQLPDCYQPNDRLRDSSATWLSRTDHGLPESGFVFCAFNNAYKITAPVFGIWMRLLGKVPGSVLWLLDANALAKDNLRREAQVRGIDPERLVFAPRVSIADHLARYAHADLFLDNLPVNAHTTASEALWSGLPLVTCLGEDFVGRVAGSLLAACGLPELVTEPLADYEALAMRLAENRDERLAVRARLTQARQSARLFDTARYTRNLEAAFVHMMHLHQAGRAPQAFSVAELADAESAVRRSG
ncbi:MAG: tetratricopeptide repeat protein [Rhodomicrobiaceae bacterium]